MEEEIMMKDEKVINRKFVIDNQEKLDLAISFNISKTISMVVDSINRIKKVQDYNIPMAYEIVSSTETLLKNGNDEF